MYDRQADISSETMNLESVSATSTLNHIIDKIEIECEVSSRIVGDLSACPGSSDENRTTATRSTAAGPGPMRSTESGASEVTCRICYDSNPLFPILFPCRCKVVLKKKIYPSLHLYIGDSVECLI